MSIKLNILILLSGEFISGSGNFNLNDLKINTLIIFLSVSLIAVSCVEVYKPDLGGKYENALVVDGTITNNPGPYTVKLMRSSSVEHPELVYYPGCEVSILCQDGKSEVLIEEDKGIYRTSVDGIRGEIGKNYKIRIVTPEDDIYESSFEKLNVPVKIESVYADIDYRYKEGLNHDLRGYQFYIDTKPALNDTSYLLWRPEATYKYHSDFYCFYYFDNDELMPFPGTDSLFTCWRTTKIPVIYTYETKGLTEPVVKRYPLNFVSTEGRDLSLKYSLLVRQLTISKRAFTFWNSLRRQNENLTSLYTVLPYQIRGNVNNINNSNEPVYGYFLVAGIDEQRIFKDRPPLRFYYSKCQITKSDIEKVAWVRYAPERDWPIYLTKYKGVLALPLQYCIDCRKKGGTVVKPDFWKDE